MQTKQNHCSIHSTFPRKAPGKAGTHSGIEKSTKRHKNQTAKPTQQIWNTGQGL